MDTTKKHELLEEIYALRKTANRLEKELESCLMSTDAYLELTKQLDAIRKASSALYEFFKGLQ